MLSPVRPGLPPCLPPQELLSCLSTLGHIMGLSPAIMGVTVLAWGNSIGDLVADVALARSGEPVVALAGCYAGPMFNMLIGLGLAFIIKTAFMYPQPYGAALPVLTAPS